jgi:hypothetical protein
MRAPGSHINASKRSFACLSYFCMDFDERRVGKHFGIRGFYDLTAVQRYSPF